MIYRTEHPKPQFMRENWVNLNGEWQFEIDNSKSGTEKGFHSNLDMEFSMRINVPFCPESKLSGIENTDFMNVVWYKRDFDITEEQLKNRVVIHFGAVDYDSTLYINGEWCRNHKGGYVSFSCDITDHLKPGKNTVTVRATDDVRDRLVPSGKQSMSFCSQGCVYTRTTGIWQTVWLEFVPNTHIVSAKYVPDAENARLNITADLIGEGTFKAQAFYDGKPMGSAQTEANGGNVVLNIDLAEKHLWEVGNGRLYDLVLTYGDDTVKSYFGLRSLRLDGYKFLINEKSVFQRLVLDQGFYPDGVYTAPDDEEFVMDIKRSLAMGFNGARLHEKVFEERFLYHCDRMGYIVWGEYPNWGLDHSYADSILGILPEWLEVVERDFNHPAIVGWCPFNETWDQYKGRQVDEVISTVYNVTKAVDPTRPCIDTSGNFHVITDIFDVHDYEQDPVKFGGSYWELPTEGTFQDKFYGRQVYKKGQPMFVSEYGGIRWSDEESGWGYGEAPKTREEFLERLKGLTDVLLDNKCMLGLCYTQLTDVEQEQNGLYTYDRRPKFDPEVIHKIFSRKAAIED